MDRSGVEVCHQFLPQPLFRKRGRHAAFHDACRSCRRMTQPRDQQRQHSVIPQPPVLPVTALLRASAISNGPKIQESTHPSPSNDHPEPRDIIPALTAAHDAQNEVLHYPSLAGSADTLFKAKAAKKLSFEQIARHIGRNEVATAAIFYGQAKASTEDIQKLSLLLDIPLDVVEHELGGFLDRGCNVPMPPKEPLIYRLYEIVQNYGYAYKAVLNEKFGDGIMSSISFSTKVEKETDMDGNKWAVITMRGKWLPYSRF